MRKREREREGEGGGGYDVCLRGKGVTLCLKSFDSDF